MSALRHHNLVNMDNIRAVKDAMGSRVVIGDFSPAVFVLEPTNRCNADCIMCPNSQLSQLALGDMPVSLFEKIVRQISPTAELTMLYFMGESSLHPNFGELLSIARAELRGKIVLSTNASELTDDMIAALVNNTDLIIACIDRWEPNVYERIRRGCSFVQTVSSIERLLTARGENQHPRVIVKALDIHFPGEHKIDLAAEEAAFARYWESRGAILLSGWLNTWAGQLGGLKKMSRLITPYVTTKRQSCADLWFKMVINWRGEVVLCCHNWDSSLLLGNLESQSPEEIWQSPSVTNVRAAHLEANFSCNKLCNRCEEWGEPAELDAYLHLQEDDLYRVF